MKNGKNETDPDQDIRDRISSLTNPTATRRGLLAVIGIAAVAGCSDSDTGETDDSSGVEPADDEGTPAESVITPAEIISQHSDQLRNLSYTFTVNYQGEESGPDNENEIEYKYDDDRGIAELDKETTIDDGVEGLSQLYAEDRVIANVTFKDHDSITVTLRESENEHQQLTGESIFDYYFPGTIFDESHEEEITKDDGSVTAYEIVSHRSYDSLGGILKVDNEGLVRLFRFEWVDGQGEEHWIEFDLGDVGQTSVDIGPEFEVSS